MESIQKVTFIDPKVIKKSVQEIKNVHNASPKRIDAFTWRFIRSQLIAYRQLFDDDDEFTEYVKKELNVNFIYNASVLKTLLQKLLENKIVERGLDISDIKGVGYGIGLDKKFKRHLQLDIITDEKKFDDTEDYYEEDEEDYEE